MCTSKVIVMSNKCPYCRYPMCLFTDKLVLALNQIYDRTGDIGMTFALMIVLFPEIYCDSWNNRYYFGTSSE
jgi:hypothetical protein